MEDKTKERRKRRRMLAGKKMDENKKKSEIQKTIENCESNLEIQMETLQENSRRDGYLGCEFESGGEKTRTQFDASSEESTESKDLTYSIHNNINESENLTYSIDKSENLRNQPVPAPRKKIIQIHEQEKVSSDTDRDVTEIDLDDIRIKTDQAGTPSAEVKVPEAKNSVVESSRSRTTGDSVVVPVPKPRKILTQSQLNKSPGMNLKIPATKSKSLENLNKNPNQLDERTIKSDAEYELKAVTAQKPKSDEFPLIKSLEQNESGSKQEEKSKKNTTSTIRKILNTKPQRKTKAKGKKSSKIKLDSGKIPKIALIWKELKESSSKKENIKEEDCNVDFQIDSPKYAETALNEKIYVQNKSGFYVRERDEVFRNDIQGIEDGRNKGIMEHTAVKTAILFQKYWSRCMIYFHGVLAGFAFSHAATVTAIMLHYNHEPRGFIAIYSCLSLKIHFIFYTLTTLCIISCFDRIDIGHMNRKHWQVIWKIPSIWTILVLYLISLGLTFFNQKTEARFEAHYYGNETEDKIWNTDTENNIQVNLLTWYHIIWARDILILFAWLVISLTKFSDFLFGHLNNMVKYAEEKNESSFR